jgi:TolB-like protein
MEEEEHNKDQPGQEETPPSKPSLFEELRRRKVFRVAITYAVVSWVIIQVAATTFESFGIPEWAFRFVVLMVLLGFPVAIVLAWAFELTPSGVRKTQEGYRTDYPDLNRKRNWYAIGMAAALPTLIFGTLAAVFYFGRSAEPREAVVNQSIQVDRPYAIGSVAVIPFTLFSENATVRTSADGLQDEMLTVLSEMAPLEVVSRTSTLQFAENTPGIPEMGEILGADFIVEGSIQPFGDKLRVTLQLIHAADDKHLWAETFDREPERKDEPLVFQKELAFELAMRVYQALERAYPPSGKIKATREQSISEMEEALQMAYDSFWTSWQASDWEAQHAGVVQHIESILTIDPDNFLAYECLAGIMSAAIDVGAEFAFDPEWRKAYYLILKRAYAVAPDGFDTNKHLGIYYSNYENRPGKALPYCQRAVETELELRGSIDIYTYWALLESLCDTGQGGAAVRITEEATEEGLASFSGPAWFWTRGYQILRQPHKQIEFLEMALEFVEERDLWIGIRTYKFLLATANAYWSGSNEPIDAFLEFALEVGDVPVDFLAGAAYQTRNFQRMLDIYSEIVEGSSYSVAMPMDMAGARAWAYYMTGNLPLAKSYAKGYLKELDTSPKGQWMKLYMPDVHTALHAYGNAFLGNREEALRLAEEALEYASPTRQFADYFETNRYLAVTYGFLGEDEMACELIDLMLSSPSGYSTGQLLVDPQLDTLHDSPLFQAVIRKHADQLKDPAILEDYFGS